MSIFLFNLTYDLSNLNLFNYMNYVRICYVYSKNGTISYLLMRMSDVTSLIE